MEFVPSDAYPGERLILSKAANAVVDLTERGVRARPFQLLMPLVGMGRKEAVGGKLYLTSYRLVFKSHVFNRFTGTLSILLPSIRSVTDASTFLTKQIRVSADRDSLFVVWRREELMAAIDQARRTAEPDRERIAGLVGTDPVKLGHGLQL